MITTINEFRNTINEVRLPDGFFKITNQFSLPKDDGWDIVFSKENILHIDTINKKVILYKNVLSNTNVKTDEYSSAEYPYLKLMLPEYYNKFKTNSEKLSAEETPDFLNKPTNLSFNTSIKGFDKKVKEYKLDPNTKIKISVL